MNKTNNQKGESMIKGNNNKKEINEAKQKWNTMEQYTSSPKPKWGARGRLTNFWYTQSRKETE